MSKQSLVNKQKHHKLFVRRKELRVQLNNARIADGKACCNIRLGEDARELDATLISEGFDIGKKTVWGETESQRTRRLKSVHSHLNVEDGPL